ncbi:NADP-dependent aryl-alcohol dehydrogenase [Geothrix oryzae]|uniref:NADP-dependent aryl-alcohol dehydrogenase n=1 Tax=Geothrix oryzae TaxID=2927975 RepID=A0ABN6UV72_9BACT|nr:aldo/keto reductase [Geothrix oryzae]BDU68666.1 NADP-dependent aryl-alcohol dehydrogenase [Geothrix oryzae]
MTHAKRPLGRTGLSISPLVFGGNVFGWTADKQTSFDLLDRFTGAGFETVDTADVYSAWKPGNVGGESETILGEWMRARGCRDRIILITKVGMEMGPGRKGLSGTWIERAVEDSLRRLQTDHLDVYLSHKYDPEAPHEETLAAYQKLIAAGKVRAIGASNFDATQLGAALEVAAEKGLPRYEILQPEYNLYDRKSFDGALRDLSMAEGLGVITYYSLARGFLSGKYRGEADLGLSPRGGGVKAYLNERGFRILQALDEVASRHGAKPAEVSLAWLMARPGVTAPIASATSLDQLDSLLRAASLALSGEDVAALELASRY